MATPERPASAATRPEPHCAADVIDRDELLDLIIWNAPDHEHTRMTLYRELEQAIAQTFALYEAFGGDAAQGLVWPKVER